jgi:arylsulfatase A-like enzyme
LAAKGINFSQAYSGSTVCSPSRISLLTGRDSRLLYANNNAISIRNSDVTLAQVLQQGGYEPALFVKFGVGSKVGVNDPLTMGFDYWYGFMHNIDAHRRYPEYLYRNNVKEKVEANAKGNKGAYSEELFAQEAVSYIGKKHDILPRVMICDSGRTES